MQSTQHFDVIVIGDTPKDISCAHAIGARCLAVGTGHFQADALRGYGPIASPNAGRRLLARPMHGDGTSQHAGAPSGGVAIAADGSRCRSASSPDGPADTFS